MSLGDNIKHKAEEMSDTAKEKFHQAKDTFDDQKEDADDKMEDVNATKGGEVKRDMNDPLAPNEPREYYGEEDDVTPDDRPGVVDTDRDDVMEDDF